jgi:hypothetical protein
MNGVTEVSLDGIQLYKINTVSLRVSIDGTNFIVADMDFVK